MKQEESEPWVPMHEVFGKGPIPLSSAREIKRAIDKVKSVVGGEVKTWLAIEYICADFLQGPDYDVGADNDTG